MHHTRLALFAGLMLLMPIVGDVQQVPQEPASAATAIADLKTLMKAQTTTIQLLRTRIADLDKRVTKLEEESARNPPR